MLYETIGFRRVSLSSLVPVIAVQQGTELLVVAMDEQKESAIIFKFDNIVIRRDFSLTEILKIMEEDKSEQLVYTLGGRGLAMYKEVNVYKISDLPNEVKDVISSRSFNRAYNFATYEMQKEFKRLGLPYNTREYDLFTSLGNRNRQVHQCV